jgi:hypothetical protein
MGKITSLPLVSRTARRSIWLGSGLACKNWTKILAGINPPAYFVTAKVMKINTCGGLSQSEMDHDAFFPK